MQVGTKITSIAASIFSVLSLVSPAHADDIKVKIGCTATTDCASALMAIDQGIFKRHGIDAEMVLIGINANIPAALVSDSIQVGGPGPTVFLQAVDGGLDLVTIAACSAMDPVFNSKVAAFVRNGVEIKQPKDFVGKKVSVGGLNTFMHVMFMKWLTEKGVDPHKVNFVESPFPTQVDLIKSGSVDAVLTVEPYLSLLKKAGGGYVGASYVAELARTEPMQVYATSREWANKNPEAVKSFRASVTEGAALVNSDPGKTSVLIANFTKQPLDIVKANRPNLSQPVITTAQLGWWIDVMEKLDLLQTEPDPSQLIIQ